MQTHAYFRDLYSYKMSNQILLAAETLCEQGVHFILHLQLHFYTSDWERQDQLLYGAKQSHKDNQSKCLLSANRVESNAQCSVNCKVRSTWLNWRMQQWWDWGTQQYGTLSCVWGAETKAISVWKIMTISLRALISKMQRCDRADWSYYTLIAGIRRSQQMNPTLKFISMSRFCTGCTTWGSWDPLTSVESCQGCFTSLLLPASGNTLWCSGVEASLRQTIPSWRS